MRHFSFIVFLFFISLCQVGCSPDVATSPGSEGQITKDAPISEQTSPGQSGIRNPFAEMAGASEDIEGTLAAMGVEDRTRLVLRFVSFALLYFYSLYDRYPTPEEGLAILLNPPMLSDGKTPEAIAREILLKDGWGNPIQYKQSLFMENLPGFEIKSLGADGIESQDDVFPDDVREVCIEASATIAGGGLKKN